MTPADFRARVDRAAGPRACWPWTGARSASGRGSLRFEGRQEQAHRVAYRLGVGQITFGLQVCHHCDNPICCNPAHLFLGTQRDNMRDAAAKGRLGHPWPDDDPRRGRRLGGRSGRTDFPLLRDWRVAQGLPA